MAPSRNQALAISTPMAFSGETMEARNLTDVTMLDAFSPNTIIQPLGAIRLVTRKPEGGNSGTGEVTVGEFDRIDIRGSYDLTMVEDKLFARVSASSKQRDGYFDILDYECVNGPGSLGGGTGILRGSFHTTFGFPIPLPAWEAEALPLDDTRNALGPIVSMGE